MLHNYKVLSHSFLDRKYNNDKTRYFDLIIKRKNFVYLNLKKLLKHEVKQREKFK